MLAKCISTQCDKYESCLRAKVEPNHEVNYYPYCGAGDDRWYMPTEIEVKEDENGE